jgi:uncharacterized alpha-E superfamily protein
MTEDTLDPELSRLVLSLVETCVRNTGWRISTPGACLDRGRATSPMSSS